MEPEHAGLPFLRADSAHGSARPQLRQFSKPMSSSSEACEGSYMPAGKDDIEKYIIIVYEIVYTKARSFGAENG